MITGVIYTMCGLCFVAAAVLAVRLIRFELQYRRWRRQHRHPVCGMAGCDRRADVCIHAAHATGDGCLRSNACSEHAFEVRAVLAQVAGPGRTLQVGDPQ